MIEAMEKYTLLMHEKLLYGDGPHVEFYLLSGCLQMRVWVMVEDECYGLNRSVNTDLARASKVDLIEAEIIDICKDMNADIKSLQEEAEAL